MGRIGSEASNWSTKSEQLDMAWQLSYLLLFSAPRALFAKGVKGQLWRDEILREASHQLRVGADQFHSDNLTTRRRTHNNKIRDMNFGPAGTFL
jgi:hypothetical protein